VLAAQSLLSHDVAIPTRASAAKIASRFVAFSEQRCCRTARLAAGACSPVGSNPAQSLLPPQGAADDVGGVRVRPLDLRLLAPPAASPRHAAFLIHFSAREHLLASLELRAGIIMGLRCLHCNVGAMSPLFGRARTASFLSLTSTESVRNPTD
jgi:hypothetical protein